jgi:transposase
MASSADAGVGVEAGVVLALASPTKNLAWRSLRIQHCASSTQGKLSFSRPPATPATFTQGVAMEVCHPRCCGIDVHKDTLMVCVLIEDQPPVVAEFGTTTRELLRLSDWLAGQQVPIVAMESTGVYWKPIWNLLEDRFDLLLVNAQHIKQVPGRKTDVKDCQWIAQLLRHGLLKRSFIPDRAQRELRDLTRMRTTLVGERARVANRIQKLLEDANIKLGSVVADILGTSSRQMLWALIEGKQTPQQMAQLARSTMRQKIPQLAHALEGQLREHHRFMLIRLLRQAEHLEGEIEAFDVRIEDQMRHFDDALRRLDAIPGINARAAQCMIAEIGVDMSRFPTASHLASWAGLCPGNNESAGKRRSGKTNFGNHHLKSMLVQVAWAAARSKKSYFHAQYHRLKSRRGHKKAVIAVAHSMLITAWHLLSDNSEYVDLSPRHFDDLHQHHLTRRLVHRIQQLGYQVALTPAA